MSQAQAVALRAALEGELSWRRDEIREIRNWQALGAGGESSQSLNRVLIVMLYAHLEGFVRAALSEYAKTINDCSLTVAEAKEVLSAACLMEHFKNYRRSEAGDPNDRHAKQARQVKKDAQLIQEIMALTNTPIKLEVDNVASAESNLSTIILRRNLAMLAIDHSNLDWLMNSLEGLLKRRNAIAHGDHVKMPNGRQMVELENKVFALCDSLMKVLYEAVRDQAYKR